MMKGEYFEVALEQVKELAQDFNSNKGYYLSPDYQESEVRKDFIDKFLIALGWDVNHEIQKNPFQQEVKVERGVAAGQSQRRADYAFYVAPNFSDPRLFVEAKKPFADLCSADNCFQVIRYGWNANVPIAVLTDFEEIAVLDCRYKPDIDTATSSVIERYHYLQYSDPEKFKRIFYLFYRDEVAQGSLERFAQTLPKRRGKAVQRGLFKGGWQPVDESFLEELDTHREALAKNFKSHNPELDGDTLTEVTQRALDRLVFLRFLEDKLIEAKYYVAEFGEKGNPWREFIALCRRLDNVYNGIVFKKHGILDKPTLKVDESQFADICEELAHINSPYDFNSIPIYILGSIYERFLGKVIVVTDKRAKLEPKPEVRKAGGVYYTPDYIVRYIVENTVGKLIERKSPAQIAKMRFADIACGSGSFLLNIYDLLLRYHRDWYNAHPKNAERDGCVERDDGFWHLSLMQRRKILLANIYGVDIDQQAVEVAQLSLYLKLLEEETTASARQYSFEFHETLLPLLNKNIVCGNSLIGTNILNARLFPDEEERKLNPMNFEDAFPEVMTSGGFDAIVGNPPYVRIQIMQETSPASAEYLAARYSSAARGNYDIYVVFVERALSLLNSLGKLGYILPHKFFSSQYGEPLRRLLSQGKHVSHIVHFGALQVFPGPTTYTCLLFLDKRECTKCRFIQVEDLNEWKKGDGTREKDIPANRFTEREWSFIVGKHSELYGRLDNMPIKLGEVADIFVGLQTSADDVFILDLVEEKRQMLILYSKILDEERTLEKGLLFPLVSGTDVQSYGDLPRRQYIIFPYNVVDERATLLNFDEISKKFPRTAAYLLENKKRLAQRERGRFNDLAWYRFGRSQNLGIQSRVKLCVPRLIKRLHAAWDVNGDHYLDNVDVCGITLKPGYQEQGLAYLLALLNSRLLAWYFPSVSAPFRGGWMSANKQFLSRLPFPPLVLSQPKDKAYYSEVTKQVEAIMVAKIRLAQAQTDKDKTYYENKCAALAHQIDQLVYELYGLRENEIKNVECETSDNK